MGKTTPTVYSANPANSGRTVNSGRAKTVNRNTECLLTHIHYGQKTQSVTAWEGLFILFNHLLENHTHLLTIFHRFLYYRLCKE